MNEVEGNREEEEEEEVPEKEVSERNRKEALDPSYYCIFFVP